MEVYPSIPVYPTFPKVEEWSQAISLHHLGASAAAPPNQLFLTTPSYESYPPSSYSVSPPSQSISLATLSTRSPSNPPTPFLGRVGAEPSSAIETTALPLANRSATHSKTRKRPATTAEKRATLREKNRLSKRAQRERQVQKLALLEDTVIEQGKEIEDLRRKLRRSEEVVSMLMRELQAEAGGRLGDGV